MTADEPDDPNDVLEIHEVDCELDDDAEVACTCRPMTVTIGGEG